MVDAARTVGTREWWAARNGEHLRKVGRQNVVGTNGTVRASRRAGNGGKAGTRGAVQEEEETERKRAGAHSGEDDAEWRSKREREKRHGAGFRRRKGATKTAGQ